jgi:predicted nucleic acid-binding protein
MSGRVFADANFLLYVRDQRDPAKQARASAWHDHLWRAGLGRTSMQVLSEYYVNLKRMARSRMTPEQAWTDAERFLAWKPQAVDEDVVRNARRIEQRYGISWWDSMVVAAAQLQDCALLLTEDLQDGGVYGTVTVRSPFTLEVREAAASYAVTYEAMRRAASPHRARGRPRRMPRVTIGA